MAAERRAALMGSPSEGDLLQLEEVLSPPSRGGFSGSQRGSARRLSSVTPVPSPGPATPSLKRGEAVLQHASAEGAAAGGEQVTRGQAVLAFSSLACAEESRAAELEEWKRQRSQSSALASPAAETTPLASPVAAAAGSGTEQYMAPLP